MNATDVRALVDTLDVLDDPAAGPAALADAGVALRRLRGWLDGCDARLAWRMAATVPLPEQALAGLARATPGQVDRVLQRAATAEAVPALGAALGDGDVRGEHVDVLGRALASLAPVHRAGLLAEADRLVDVARQASPAAFRAEVARAVRRLEADDGRSRLERQRRATRLVTWVDRDSGMWCLRGELDPETGVRLQGRLAAMVESLFAKAVPATCPADPGARQDHLRALALVELCNGQGHGAGRPEVVVVVDTTVPGHGPVVDWGIPVELPSSVLVELCERAVVHPLVLRDGAVLFAPGQHDLGRTTRVASAAQRRVLRGLYPSCGVSGCSVRFDHCKIHHVLWWRHGGRTDLANLLPLCAHHHHAVHDRGWQLHLTADRMLTVTLPDGTVMTTGPPKRVAA